MKRKEQAKYWDTIVEAFKDSGQSISTWCRNNEVKEHQLRYRLNRTHGHSATLAPKSRSSQLNNWVGLELSPIKPKNNPCLTIQMGNITIEIPEGYDGTSLQQVLKILGVGCAGDLC
jgi:hypothetical protein